MSIISQTAIIGTDAVAPGGNLYAGIPFVEVFLCCGLTQVACFLYPVSQTEFRTGGEQLVLQQNHLQETVGILVKLLAGE